MYCLVHMSDVAEFIHISLQDERTRGYTHMINTQFKHSAFACFFPMKDKQMLRGIPDILTMFKNSNNSLLSCHSTVDILSRLTKKYCCCKEPARAI